MALDTVLQVAAGVILDAQKNNVLLSYRDANRDQGNLWEYPGGKVEVGEAPVDALTRELREELAIDVLLSSPLSVIHHRYSHRSVELHFFVVETFSGEPQAMEAQAWKWWPVQALEALDFPEANKPVQAQLQQWLVKSRR